MPTVAACGLHFDARAASSPHPFLLDAGELCTNAFLAGLSDLTATSGQLKSHADLRMGCDASDSLLLGGLHYSDDELSPGSSHVNGGAAMQFLLLDDDEVAGAGPEEPAGNFAADGSFATTSAGCARSDGAMLRQQSGHSCEVATRPSVPVVDSSALYCLAVVDELTGLPLRPATPEETWEVERCFVLQQQSELIEAGMLPELQHDQLLAPQLQQEPLATSRAGSAEVSAVGDMALQHLHVQQQAVLQGPSHALDQQEEQQEEQPKAEPSRRSKEAPAARAAGPPQRRPDQPRRCGPCDNCGATESPQWRQGPPAKPLLCNACGMRFRRTNQLVAGETGASGVRGGARAHKKVAPPADVEADVEVVRTAKATKAVAPPLVAPDAKRPRRAAAVAAAATFAAAAIDVM